MAEQNAKKQETERQKALEAEAQLNAIAGMLLDDAARARLGNVKLVNRELYLKAIQAIVYLQNSGRIQGKLDDEQLKNLLENLRDKREITIRRK
ncbi:MAG: DNA-binding protein [Candidatus Diapherotrites archaeon]|uniref:DNA-binding protein n=1 Tax=Candidatus Iainarchaeum sp. TaxID=3101447 RepID=A0A938YQT4_9ARCH|nr:DNA-binding protein [Candidatus Diapherotrites archaeon]